MTVALVQTESNVTMFPPECVTLPVSEIIFGDRRLEAEVYLSDGFTVRHRIHHSSLPISPLRTLAKIWQPGRLKGIQVGKENGAPYLAATQVFDIWPKPRKWLAHNRIDNAWSRYVSPNCILVTRSGTVGNVIMTYAAHVNIVISDDLIRIESDDPEMRSYVYAFLRTRFARMMMRGSHYGNVIKHLEVAHLEEIPVPILNQLRAEIHERIEAVFAARDEAHRLDMESRKCFSEVMKDRPDAPGEEGYSVSSSYLYSGRRRLEASAHSPESQLVSQVYQRNAESVVALGTIARAFVPGRFKRIFGETGTSYLDSEPIFRINPELTKFLTAATKIDFEAYMVRSGWLLMACSGQIYGINGQAILANEWHERKVLSQHIMRIIPDPDKIRSGYLQTVLSHPVLGQPLVVSRAYGSSVPELAPEDIERLPIPRLARRVEEEIANMAERASELRMKADIDENYAIAILEHELTKNLGFST